MELVRIGVIGPGLAFTGLHVPVFAAHPQQFQVAGICGRTIERASEAAYQVGQALGYTPGVFASAGALLERADIDAVDIAVPIHLTAGYVRQALLAGRHVFAEKPVAASVEEGLELMRLAQQQKRVLFIGENFRYQHRFEQVHALVESGLVGEPVLYLLNDLHDTDPTSPYPATSWRREGAHLGGYLVDGGVHTVAGMRSMTRRCISRLSALSASFHPEWLSRQDDTLLVNLSFSDGLVGQLNLGYGAVEREGRQARLYGREGTLVLRSRYIEIWRRSQERPAETIPLEDNGPGFREEWLDFYAMLVDSHPWQDTALESLRDLQVVLLGMQAARATSVLEVPDITL